MSDPFLFDSCEDALRDVGGAFADPLASHVAVGPSTSPRGASSIFDFLSGSGSSSAVTAVGTDMTTSPVATGDDMLKSALAMHEAGATATPELGLMGMDLDMRDTSATCGDHHQLSFGGFTGIPMPTSPSSSSMFSGELSNSSPRSPGLHSVGASSTSSGAVGSGGSLTPPSTPLVMNGSASGGGMSDADEDDEEMGGNNSDESTSGVRRVSGSMRLRQRATFRLPVMSDSDTSSSSSSYYSEDGGGASAVASSLKTPSLSALSSKSSALSAVDDELFSKPRGKKRGRKAHNVDLDSIDTSNLDKRERNRISAAKYRKRRKNEMEHLRDIANKLRDENTSLREQLDQARAETQSLHEQLSFLRKLVSDSGVHTGNLKFVLFGMFLVTCVAWTVQSPIAMASAPMSSAGAVADSYVATPHHSTLRGHEHVITYDARRAPTPGAAHAGRASGADSSDYGVFRKPGRTLLSVDEMEADDDSPVVAAADTATTRSRHLCAAPTAAASASVPFGAAAANSRSSNVSSATASATLSGNIKCRRPFASTAATCSA